MAQSTARGRGWSHHLEDPIPGNVLKCVEELGIDIKRVVEDEALGHCPAHVRRTGKQDRSPSWSVNLDSGVHNCFSCGFRGPFVTLVEETLECSPETAVLWIKARGSIDRAKKILGQGENIHDLMAARPPEVNEADLALYVEVPEWAAEVRDLDPASCDHYGVLWDAERDHWIIPIRDPRDNTLMGWQQKGEHTRYFRNRPRDVKKAQTLFGLQQHVGETAILLESPLDVVRLHTAGIEGGLASFGVHVSDAQMSLLVQRARVIIIALDNDRDGITESDELRDRFRYRPHRNLRYLDYSHTDAKDIGDMTDSEIRQAVDNAYSSVLWVKR